MAKRAKRTWLLILIGASIFVLIGGLIALQPGITPLYWLMRTSALLGYVSIFLAIVSSAYMKQLVRTFGRPFVKVHHVMSVTGLVSILIHPLSVAWSFGGLNVFVPVFDSWLNFLTWGGRVAWYLFAIAALVALLRASLKKQWRPIHMINYLAFFLTTAHAILLGSDMQSLVMKIVAILMTLVVVGIFVLKRMQRRQIGARKR